MLAKQLATLDCLSNGRVQIGLGVGWQEDEYVASGLPFEGRYGYLLEQVEAMRALWSQAPASFQGKYINFSGIHSRPFPVQGAKLPIYFGLPPTDRNIERIAAHADGWLPMDQDPEKLAPVIAKLREAFAQRGRDPASLEVRVAPPEVYTDGRPDFEGMLRGVPALLAAGVTQLQFRATASCRNFDEFPAMCERLVAFRETIG